VKPGCGRRNNRRSHASRSKSCDLKGPECRLDEGKKSHCGKLTQNAQGAEVPAERAPRLGACPTW
jgi:hypothetical protein